VIGRRVIGRLVHRRAWLPRRVRIAVTVVCGSLALLGLAGNGRDAAAQFPEAPGPVGSSTGEPPESELERAGRRLFVDNCASCHGQFARGIPGLAPSLHGVGAQSADFNLRTGRMPMTDPEDQPSRKEPVFPEPQRRALVAT